MKYTELEIGKIYHCIWYGVNYVMLHNGGTTSYLNLGTKMDKGGTYSNSGGFNSVNKDCFTPATPEQEAQLLASIREKRFVPLTDLKPIYEIY